MQCRTPRDAVTKERECWRRLDRAKCRQAQVDSVVTAAYRAGAEMEVRPKKTVRCKGRGRVGTKRADSETPAAMMKALASHRVTCMWLVWLSNLITHLTSRVKQTGQIKQTEQTTSIELPQAECPLTPPCSPHSSRISLPSCHMRPRILLQANRSQTL